MFEKTRRERTATVSLSYRMIGGSGALLPAFLRMRDVGMADASYRIVDNFALFARGLATPTTPTCLIIKETLRGWIKGGNKVNCIRLSNGEVLESLSRAAERMKELVTGKYIAANGWRCWRVGERSSAL